MKLRAEITKEQIIEYYVDGGLTTLETAERLGVSEATLLRHMRFHGIVSRPVGSRVPEAAEAFAERDRLIAKRRADGASMGAIAAEFRISRQRVHSILNGVKTSALRDRKR